MKLQNFEPKQKSTFHFVISIINLTALSKTKNKTKNLKKKI
jgi:hypothetical protein